MKGEWRVTCNPVGDKYLYRVYRLRNVNGVDHSGNREYYGDYSENCEELEALAAKLNREEIEIDESLIHRG